MHATLTAGPIETAFQLFVAATRLLDRALLAAFAAIWAVQARARERALLASLDARALADMGITRCDVMCELEKPFWRD